MIIGGEKAKNIVDIFERHYQSSQSEITNSFVIPNQEQGTELLIGWYPESNFDTKMSHWVVPIGIETLESFGTHALDFIKDIGHRIVESPGEKKAASWLMEWLFNAGTAVAF